MLVYAHRLMQHRIYRWFFFAWTDDGGGSKMDPSDHLSNRFAADLNKHHPTFSYYSHKNTHGFPSTFHLRRGLITFLIISFIFVFAIEEDTQVESLDVKFQLFWHNKSSFEPLQWFQCGNCLQGDMKYADVLQHPLSLKRRNVEEINCFLNWQ